MLFCLDKHLSSTSSSKYTWVITTQLTRGTGCGIKKMSRDQGSPWIILCTRVKLEKITLIQTANFCKQCLKYKFLNPSYAAFFILQCHKIRKTIFKPHSAFLKLKIKFYIDLITNILVVGKNK